MGVAHDSRPADVTVTFEPPRREERTSPRQNEERVVGVGHGDGAGVRG